MLGFTFFILIIGYGFQSKLTSSLIWSFASSQYVYESKPHHPTRKLRRPSLEPSNPRSNGKYTINSEVQVGNRTKVCELES